MSPRAASVRAVLVALLPAAERALSIGLGYLKVFADSRPDLAAGAHISLIELACEDGTEAALRAILETRPDIVGLHVQLCNEEEVVAVANALRRERPEALVVLGGQEATCHPERLLRRTRADAVVLGEGEETFAELLGVEPARWSTVAGLALPQGEQLVRTAERRPPADLAALPSPFGDEALVQRWRQLPAAVIETTRGCPYGCRFCSWPNSMKPRHFPLDRVSEEIATVLGMRPNILVHLADPDIFLYPDRALVILRAIREHDPAEHSQWWFNTYFGNMTEELASLCNHRGFVLEGGVQTTNPEALRASRRRFDADGVKRAVRLLQQHAPRATLAVQLILGLPGDSLDGYLRSLDWVCRLGVKAVHVFHLQLMPGADFRHSLDELGIHADPAPPYALHSSTSFPPQAIAEGRRAALRLSLLSRYEPVREALLQGAGADSIPHCAAELIQLADRELGLGLEAAITSWESRPCAYLTPITAHNDPVPAFRLIEAAEAWLSTRRHRSARAAVSA